MTTKKVGSETDLIQCPYDVSHQIVRHRFQVHLVRCRDNYPNAVLVTCPFNVTHRINKEELNWHVSVCPERQTFENFKHREMPIEGLSTTVDNSFSGNNSMREGNTSRRPLEPLVPAAESWDDEPDVPAYDPSKYVEKAPVLRLPVGMTPSQRSAFREAERKRLHSLAKP